MALRQMWNMDKASPLNKERILFIREAIPSAKPEDVKAEFSIAALRRAVGLDDAEYPKLVHHKTAQDKALSSLMKHGVGMGGKGGPWVVTELHTHWSEKAVEASGPLEDGDRPCLIYDLPNIYHSMQNRNVNFEVFIDHISATDSTLFAHVTLTFLLENWSAVERLMEVSPDMKFVYPHLYGHVDEDASMLQFSIDHNAGIVTNDKMRSERGTYPELQKTGVFSRLLTYSIASDEFQLHR
ncbi:MAG: hypothetical protein CMN86_01745 [Stappia sp.]|nr:hypothetical protein [Stappia sp.]